MNEKSREDEDLQPRSMRLLPEVWRALDADAKRCKRSSVKQLEALLATYYGLEDVGFDDASLERTRAKVSGLTGEEDRLGELEPLEDGIGNNHAQ